jgi:hypothetical protein
MRRAGILALGAWMLLTATALVVSWLGVGAVTRAVSASAQPVIPLSRLVVGQSSSSPVQSAPPATTVPTTSTTTTTLPAAPPARVPTSVSTRTSSPVQLSAPATTVPTTTTTIPVASPSSTSTQPVSTGTSSPPPSEPATYSTPGGQATVRCSGDEISLVNTFPANGYQLKVDNGGPKVVTVSFSGPGADYQISAVCQNGNPVRVEGGGSGNTQGTAASKTQDPATNKTPDAATNKTQDSVTGSSGAGSLRTGVSKNR